MGLFLTALPNSFWVKELRGFTGRDTPVAAFFAKHRTELDGFPPMASQIHKAYQSPEIAHKEARQMARTGYGFASLFKEYLSYRFGERRQRFCLMAKEGGDAFVSRSAASPSSAATTCSSRSRSRTT